MKIIINKTHQHNGAWVRRGIQLDVEETRGNDLVRVGIASPASVQTSAQVAGRAVRNNAKAPAAKKAQEKPKTEAGEQKEAPADEAAGDATGVGDAGTGDGADQS